MLLLWGMDVNCKGNKRARVAHAGRADGTRQFSSGFGTAENLLALISARRTSFFLAWKARRGAREACYNLYKIAYKYNDEYKGVVARC